MMAKLWFSRLSKSLALLVAAKRLSYRTRDTLNFEARYFVDNWNGAQVEFRLGSTQESKVEREADRKMQWREDNSYYTCSYCGGGATGDFSPPCNCSEADEEPDDHWGQCHRCDGYAANGRTCVDCKRELIAGPPHPSNRG